MVIRLKVFNEIIGKYIEIPNTPKIISLAPSITDTLDQLGVWENVIGVSLYCNIPPKASQKPRVGAYLKVRYSKIDELEPDIIFTTTGVQRKLSFEMLDKGYPVYPVPLPISLHGILENMAIIGGVLNKTQKALELMKIYIDILSQIKKGHLGTVYYEIDFGEPYTIGGISYINHSLDHIGLRNIFTRQEKTYFKPDLKEVYQKNPDLILYELHPGRKTDEDTLLKIFDNRGWSKMKAVKNNNIFILPPDSLAHYGPRHILNLQKISEKVIKKL